ncbi:DUF4998 domain-containing protein [Sunxiuqinia sp. A32]|uniref:DUF4998 domain-containing protein n=1 Tax=Sunxiuqinia sp. A32 TaxID=3461496 RepID=UPI004045A9A6
MQTRYLNIFLFVGIILVTTFGCSDMDSIHEEYLQGEKIYAGKLDSVKVLNGYKRVKIIGFTRFLGNSNECTVSWEDQSQTFAIDKDGSETFEMIVDSLDERSYEFSIFTTDDLGNESIMQTVRGRAVGDIFKSTQKTRRITTIEPEGEETLVYWADQAESEFVIFTELKYENNNDEMTTVIVNAEDSQTKLENWKPLGNMEISSAVISGELGFDTIYLDVTERLLPEPPYSELNKNYHSLVWMPSDLPGTSNNEPNQYLFDGIGWIGDRESYHSGDNTGGTPAHITIDLGVKAVVRKVEVGMRVGYTGNNPVEVELWGIDDITNAETSGSDEAEFVAKGWTKLNRSRVDSKQESFTIDLPVGPSVRYIRYRCLETETGNERAHQITELTFWGQDIEPIELDKSLHNLMHMPSDLPGTTNNEPNQYLFDNVGWVGDGGSYHSGDNTGGTPAHITIDLGVITHVARVDLGLRDPNNYSGNNPVLVEFWGIMDITDAETSSSDAEEFEAKGWQLLYRAPVDSKVQTLELDIPEGPEVRYVRYRCLQTETGNEKAHQLTEMTFYGLGTRSID